MRHRNSRSSVWMGAALASLVPLGVLAPRASRADCPGRGPQYLDFVAVNAPALPDGKLRFGEVIACGGPYLQYKLWDAGIYKRKLDWYGCGPARVTWLASRNRINPINRCGWRVTWTGDGGAEWGGYHGIAPYDRSISDSGAREFTRVAARERKSDPVETSNEEAARCVSAQKDLVKLLSDAGRARADAETAAVEIDGQVAVVVRVPRRRGETSDATLIYLPNTTFYAKTARPERGDALKGIRLELSKRAGRSKSWYVRLATGEDESEKRTKVFSADEVIADQRDRSAGGKPPIRYESATDVHGLRIPSTPRFAFGPQFTTAGVLTRVLEGRLETILLELLREWKPASNAPVAMPAEWAAALREARDGCPAQIDAVLDRFDDTLLRPERLMEEPAAVPGISRRAVSAPVAD